MFMKTQQLSEELRLGEGTVEMPFISTQAVYFQYRAEDSAKKRGPQDAGITLWFAENK
jgi:hypothetical protein